MSNQKQMLAILIHILPCIRPAALQQANFEFRRSHHPQHPVHWDRSSYYSRQECLAPTHSAMPTKEEQGETLLRQHLQRFQGLGHARFV